MKIILPTIGSRGDIQPYIALALGLKDARHDVLLATHPLWRDLVESHGIPFAPMGPDIDIGEVTARIRRRSPNWILGFVRVMNFAFAMVEQSHDDLLRLCRGMDLVVISHASAGSMEADQLRLPNVSVTLQPQGLPANDPNQPLLRKALMSVAAAGMGLLMTRPFNQMRKRAGLPPLGPTGIRSPLLNLIPLSPSVYPPNPYWGPGHAVTGFWFVPPPTDWKPPEDLVRFLEAGDPPIVVSLGAMALSGEDALEAAAITLEAVRAVGVRAIVQGWDEAMGRLALPETVIHAGSVPHQWLLPQAGGMVHHGGFGTTSAGLLAGIPALVIPHIIDQFIWGQKVAELGVGPQPIARNRLSARKMTEALTQMQTPGMRDTARSLGARIRSEPGGLNLAVSLIEEVMAQGRH